MQNIASTEHYGVSTFGRVARHNGRRKKKWIIRTRNWISIILWDSQEANNTSEQKQSDDVNSGKKTCCCLSSTVCANDRCHLMHIVFTTQYKYIDMEKCLGRRIKLVCVVALCGRSTPLCLGLYANVNEISSHFYGLSHWRNQLRHKFKQIQCITWILRIAVDGVDICLLIVFYESLFEW